MKTIAPSLLSLMCGALLVGEAQAAQPKAALPKPAQQVQAPQPAQPAAGGAQTPTDIKHFDDWIVRCFPVQTNAPCDVFQLVVQKTSNQHVLSVSIAYSPRDDSYAAQFIVPWGVALTSGLTIEAGKYSAKALAFRRCNTNGCYVEGRLDNATVDALSAPLDKATFKIMSYEGQAINVPLSLKGFSAALAAMKADARAKAPQ